MFTCKDGLKMFHVREDVHREKKRVIDKEMCRKKEVQSVIQEEKQTELP